MHQERKCTGAVATAAVVAVRPIAHVAGRTIGLKAEFAAANQPSIRSADREGSTFPPQDPIVRPLLERTLDGAHVRLFRPPTEASRRLLIFTGDVRFYVVG